MSSQKDENKNITFEVRIDISPGYMIDRQWAAEAYIATWGSAGSCLSNWKLDFGKGQIEFIGDWTSVAAAALASHQSNMRYFSGPISDDELQCLCDEFKNRPVEETPTISVKLSGPQEIFREKDDFLRMYLMNCFLALNLSAPGCARMRAEFQGQYSLKKVEFSELNWFLAWHEIWPVIQSVPLADTVKWLSDVRFGKGQLAETAVDKLLIALLRVSDEADWGPEHILWFSQALEAIVDSPVERITHTLQQRLLTLLGAPHSLAKTKKQINKFYALRSRIAHGDFQFIHPVGNQRIDPRIETVNDELSQAANFGMAALVAIAQLFVRQHWQAVSFVEQIRGTNIEDSH